MKNVGDEAFRCVFRQCFKGHEIEFVNPRDHKQTSPDVVILGGGAVVNPYYLSVLPDCPRYAIGVDIAYESEMDLLTQSRFRGIMVRNESDIDLLKKKVDCPVEAIPDLAFYLKPSGTEILTRYRDRMDMDKNKNKIIGVFATDYVNPAIDRPIEEFAEKSFNFKLALAAELDQLMEDGYEIILVPCATAGYGDDRRINLDIASFMKHVPTMVMDTLSPQDMIDLIADLDATICMRFHSHIFSMIAGTPFVSIEYTRKVKLLLEEHNLTNATAGVWNGNAFDASKMRETIAAVAKPEMKQFLSGTAACYRERLYDVMKSVRREWLTQSP